MANERVLIVEDELLLAEQIAVQLEDYGYQVVGIFTIAENAINELDILKPDIVLMDIMLPGEIDGIEAAQQIKQHNGIPVVYLTAYDDKDILDRARITEPFGYILKPYSPRELNANIAMALYKSKSEKQLLSAACTTEVYDSISDALIGLDSDGLIKTVNSTAASSFGIEKENIIDKSWSELLHCQNAVEQDLLKEVVEEKDGRSGKPQTIEIDLLTRGDSVISVELRLCAVNKRDSILKSVLVIRDVSERKAVEQELAEYRGNLEGLVQERTQELYRINQELDTYNYSVSHDLRAPLRAIDGFSQALMEDYRDQLDTQALSYLQRVRSASQRMGELIDDLLMLSRISMNDIICEEIDLSALADVITDVVRDRNPEREIYFRVQQGMTANGDVRLIRILLENLVDNAIKFTQGNVTADIEIGQKLIDDGLVYYVRDNGVGFDMTYSDKIFNVFQRLHSADKYEGTGVGLAIVQRIVHKHRGNIWAEGEAGKGACFYFTLDEHVCDMQQIMLAGTH
jgi:PAS domain S-box-containing protein